MPTLEELLAEALKLDPEVRSDLARRLTESVEQYRQAAVAATENERERQWIQEAMRRSRELRAKAAEHPLGSPPDREMVSAPKPAERATESTEPSEPRKPAAKPKPRPRPVAKSKPKAKAKPRPKSKPKAKPKPRPKPKPKSRPRPKSKPKARPRRRR
jgi:outer membrane biosynthesis protein TonB